MGVGAGPLPTPSLSRLLTAYGALAALLLLLATIGVLPRWAGLVHLVALPPLDLFADLRILVTRAPSYPVFVLGLAASVGARAAVLAWALGGLDRPRIRFALLYYLAVTPIAFAAASFAFTGFASFGSPFLWLSILGLLGAMLLLAALPWAGTARLGDAAGASVREWLRFSTVATYLVAVMLVGALAAVLPAGPFLLVSVSAALTAGTAWVLARGDRRLLAARRVVAAAFALAAVAAVAVVRAEPDAPMPPTEEAGPHEGSLLLMSGMNSASGTGAIQEIDPRVAGFPCERTWYYSYGGPGDGQPRNDARCEIRTGAPYEMEDTIRPFREMVRFTPPQLRAVPEPVTLMSHSQGIWVVYEAMSREGAMGVENLVLVGVFRQDLLAYPPPGVEGPGRVGVDAVRVIVELVEGDIREYHPGEPLVQDMMATPGAIERVMGQGVPPGVRVLSVPSALDLPLMPEGWRVPEAVNACPLPVTHGNLPYDRELHLAVDRFLKGEPQPDCPAWRVLAGPVGVPFTTPRAQD